MAEVPTDLHELLDGQIAWTDELWDQGLGLLLDAITFDEAAQMYALLIDWLHRVKHFERVYDSQGTRAVESDEALPREAREKLLEDFRRCKPAVLVETLNRVRTGTVFGRPPVQHGANLGEELWLNSEA